MQDETGSRGEERRDNDGLVPEIGARSEENPPIFNLPTGILVALALICGIYAIQQFLLSPALNQWVAVEFGFSPIRYLYPLDEQSLAWLWTPVSYSLLHGSFEHLAFNSLWLAAFGTPVCRRIGEVRFLLFWVVSSVACRRIACIRQLGRAILDGRRVRGDFCSDGCRLPIRFRRTAAQPGSIVRMAASLAVGGAGPG